MNLHTKKCVPCEGGVLPFNKEEAQKYLEQLNKSWEISDDNKWLSRKFSFKNFKEVMVFVNKVANIANEENHHPDMSVHYSKVIIKLTTHEIEGLSENDFILGAKIDQL